MNPKHINTLMIGLSIAYAAAIGILATTGSGAVGLTALIGACVLGVGWTVSGMLTRRQRD